MKAEMLLKLLDAGYTKADIDLMEELETPTAQPAAEQKPAEQKPAEQKPAEQKPAEQTPAEEQKPIQQTEDIANVSNTLKALTETVQSLAQTVQAMQQANIKNAESTQPKRFDTAEALKDFFGGQKKA